MTTGAVTSTDWLLWQLADSAFPTGGFAHSGGLEAAHQHGEVRNIDDLSAYLDAALEQASRASLPFVSASFSGSFHAADRLCEAFISNHIANHASRSQGRAFMKATQRAFPQLTLNTPPFGHLAPAAGAITAGLGLERLTALRLYLFMQLRGWISAAVRLSIVGPLEAQAIQAVSARKAEGLLNADFSLENAAQTAPLLEILQACHKRLYSRLFQS